MFRSLLFVAFVGASYGLTLKSWGASSDTYATKCAAYVTTMYNSLLNESETFKATAQQCAVSVNQSAENCFSCLNTVDCDPSNNILDQIMNVVGQANPENWGPKLETELTNIANSIANGAEALYNKYGAPAINALSNGINAIGNTFKDIGNAIGSALTKAFEFVKNVISGLMDLIGLRKKRGVMVAEAAVVGEPTLVREKRATNFTDEQRACLDKCAACSPFTSDEEYAGRQICGDAVWDKKTDLEKRLTQLEKFYGDYQNATGALIKDAFVDTDTMVVAKFSAQIGGSYQVLDCFSAGIAFDLWNQDAAYQSMVEYVYNLYKQ